MKAKFVLVKISTSSFVKCRASEILITCYPRNGVYLKIRVSEISTSEIRASQGPPILLRFTLKDTLTTYIMKQMISLMEYIAFLPLPNVMIFPFICCSGFLSSETAAARHHRYSFQKLKDLTNFSFRV